MNQTARSRPVWNMVWKPFCARWSMPHVDHGDHTAGAQTNVGDRLRRQQTLRVGEPPHQALLSALAVAAQPAEPSRRSPPSRSHIYSRGHSTHLLNSLGLRSSSERTCGSTSTCMPRAALSHLKREDQRHVRRINGNRALHDPHSRPGGCLKCSMRIERQTSCTR